MLRGSDVVETANAFARTSARVVVSIVNQKVVRMTVLRCVASDESKYNRKKPSETPSRSTMSSTALAAMRI
jgi:hypothetical protein